MGCVQDVGGPLALPQLLPTHPGEVPPACLLSASSILPALGRGEEAFCPVFPSLLAVGALPTPRLSSNLSGAQLFPRMLHSLELSSWGGGGGGPCCEVGDAHGWTSGPLRTPGTEP